MIQSKLLDRINIIESRGSLLTTKNIHTKTFFNFSYKKYRFYFGIYTPCHHIQSDLNAFPIVGKCEIPVPFIISHDQRACVNYQSDFAKKNIFHNIKSKDEHKDKDMTSDFINSKTSHANLLHFRWLSG